MKIEGYSVVNGVTGETVVKQFSGPEGVTVDLEGNIYVADTGNDQAAIS